MKYVYQNLIIRFLTILGLSVFLDYFLQFNGFKFIITSYYQISFWKQIELHKHQNFMQFILPLNEIDLTVDRTEMM